MPIKDRDWNRIRKKLFRLHTKQYRKEKSLTTTKNQMLEKIYKKILQKELTKQRTKEKDKLRMKRKRERIKSSERKRTSIMHNEGKILNTVKPKRIG